MRKQRGKLCTKANDTSIKTKRTDSENLKKTKYFFNQTIYKTKNYAYEKPFKQM